MPKIKLASLAYVHYRHQDLRKEEEFLRDFGLTEARREDQRVYYKGTGPQPITYIAEQAEGPGDGQRFIAAAWNVESLEDLTNASQLPSASTVDACPHPGTGKMITLTDPNGFEIRLHHGQEMEEECFGSATAINQPWHKPRKGESVRVQPRPSRVHKLGHYGFMVPPDDFQHTLQWYTSTFNLSITDSVFDPTSGEDKTCFIHIDKREVYSDHHSFFLGQTEQDRAHIHHASFEVQDLDDQLLGHDWLKGKAWTNCWGVGRHVLGSQIFDYWFDAMGNILEHYIDGDIVNRATPYRREPESPSSLYVWGPNVPLGFVTGRVEDAHTPAIAA
ncbi:hypothetical protein LTR53_010016 [Teratosphaeriaceae sp. CCFEE 6253]|nr:hypothetical protein LTR53_010016 [Teratosphaeriaceae sp. CCFEE 6253]